MGTPYRTLLHLVAVVATVYFAQPAIAQTAGDSDADAETEAREAFFNGREAYSRGNYDTALAEFERALELSNRPALFYNIGLAHDRLRHEQEAVDYFTRYLEAIPDAPERGQLEARIRSIERALERDRERDLELERARQEAASASPTIIVEESDDTALWIGLAAGAAAIVALGVVLAVVLSGGDPEYESGDFGGVTFVLDSP